MLFRNTTMSSSDYRLSVRDNAMNPRQKPSRSFRITKDYFVVCQNLILRNPAIGSPSVGPDCLQHLPSFRCSWPTAEPFQKTLNGCSRRIFHHPHMGKPWSLPALLIPIKRNGTQNSALPFASAASFLPRRSEKRLVHLNQTCKLVLSISVCHRLPDFVGHQPSSLIIFDFQRPLHLRDRYANFFQGHVVDNPIPLEQRCSGLMKNGSCGQAGLGATSFTVQDFSRPDKPRLAITASRTDKPVWPPYFLEVLRTCLLSGKGFLKLKQTPFSVNLSHSYTLKKGT
jgi:hypothetical protein